MAKFYGKDTIKSKKEGFSLLIGYLDGSNDLPDETLDLLIQMLEHEIDLLDAASARAAEKAGKTPGEKGERKFDLGSEANKRIISIIEKFAPKGSDFVTPKEIGVLADKAGIVSATGKGYEKNPNIARVFTELVKGGKAVEGTKMVTRGDGSTYPGKAYKLA